MNKKIKAVLLIISILILVTLSVRILDWGWRKVVKHYVKPNQDVVEIKQ
jgi:hypothetical protein